jgi:hypothetical protein
LIHPGVFVRVKTSGMLVSVIRWHPDHYNHFIAQLNPFGKGRHRDRITLTPADVESVNEMEVLAEAGRGL